MFSDTPVAPPDPVFGLMDLFRQDPRAEKVNLTVGAYQDESGQTPVLECVKAAERRLLEAERSKNYLAIDGLGLFNRLVAELIYGADSTVIAQNRVAIAQTPGGTGALRIAGDFLRRALGVETIWIGSPTWANHPQIYAAANLQLKSIQYLNSAGTGVNFQELIGQLSRAEAGQAVLLHTVCHNPTGFDLSANQWDELLQLIRDRQLIPIFDFAYQGFHLGLNEDASPIRRYCQAGGEAIVCNSFSKNFGLYAERVGSISVVARQSQTVPAIQSQLKSIIRTLYSTPPKHGGAIVETILGDPALRIAWEAELRTMRDRIAQLRRQFAAELKRVATRRDFGFVDQQIGMFSFSGLNAKQAVRLREEFAIYLVESGRINVAGLNSGNLARVCQAIAAVV